MSQIFSSFLFLVEIGQIDVLNLWICPRLFFSFFLSFILSFLILHYHPRWSSNFLFRFFSQNKGQYYSKKEFSGTIQSELTHITRLWLLRLVLQMFWFPWPTTALVKFKRLEIYWLNYWHKCSEVMCKRFYIWYCIVPPCFYQAICFISYQSSELWLSLLKTLSVFIVIVIAVNDNHY